MTIYEQRARTYDARAERAETTAEILSRMGHAQAAQQRSIIAEMWRELARNMRRSEIRFGKA